MNWFKAKWFDLLIAILQISVIVYAIYWGIEAIRMNWTGRLVLYGMLIGFGLFNLKGLIKVLIERPNG